MHDKLTIIECREIEIDMDEQVLISECCTEDRPEAKALALLEIEQANEDAAEKKAKVHRENQRRILAWLKGHDLRENKRHMALLDRNHMRNLLREQKTNGTATVAAVRS